MYGGNGGGWGAHYGARRFVEHGYTVQLINPKSMKPFVKSNKNDASLYIGFQDDREVHAPTCNPLVDPAGAAVPTRYGFSESPSLPVESVSSSESGVLRL